MKLRQYQLESIRFAMNSLFKIRFWVFTVIDGYDCDQIKIPQVDCESVIVPTDTINMELREMEP